MSRPKKDGLDYFPVDTVFDEKIDAIESIHKNNGVVWVLRFWQKAYRTLTGLVDFNGLFAELFANKCRITLEEHENILKTAVLVDFCHEVSSGVYTSNGIQKRISSVSKDRKDAIERQNKGNKKKVKKRKVKDCPAYSANNSEELPNKNKIPPKIEWVEQYCRERNKGVNFQKWFNFYSSKGWMVGKNRMTDWTAAVRTWEEEKRESQYDRLRREMEQEEQGGL